MEKINLIEKIISSLLENILDKFEKKGLNGYNNKDKLLNIKILSLLLIICVVSLTIIFNWIVSCIIFGYFIISMLFIFLVVRNDIKSRFIFNISFIIGIIPFLFLILSLWITLIIIPYRGNDLYKLRIYKLKRLKRKSYFNKIKIWK